MDLAWTDGGLTEESLWIATGNVVRKTGVLADPVALVDNPDR
jgi:hypothetical protein